MLTMKCQSLVESWAVCGMCGKQVSLEKLQAGWAQLCVRSDGPDMSQHLLIIVYLMYAVWLQRGWTLRWSS